MEFVIIGILIFTVVGVSGITMVIRNNKSPKLKEFIISDSINGSKCSSSSDDSSSFSSSSTSSSEFHTSYTYSSSSSGTSSNTYSQEESSSSSSADSSSSSADSSSSSSNNSSFISDDTLFSDGLSSSYPSNDFLLGELYIRIIVGNKVDYIPVQKVKLFVDQYKLFPNHPKKAFISPPNINLDLIKEYADVKGKYVFDIYRYSAERRAFELIDSKINCTINETNVILFAHSENYYDFMDAYLPPLIEAIILIINC